jgi:hypothetical protein
MEKVKVKSNKKVVLILLGLGAVGAAVYFIFFNKSENNPLAGLFGDDTPKNSGNKVGITKGYVSPAKTNTVVQNNTAPVKTCSGYKAESWPLAVCMKGPNVKAMQTILNTVYKDVIGQQLVADGSFGPKTGVALRAAIGRDTLTQNDFNQMAKAHLVVAGSSSRPTMPGGYNPFLPFNPFSLF